MRNGAHGKHTEKKSGKNRKKAPVCSGIQKEHRTGRGRNVRFFKKRYKKFFCAAARAPLFSKSGAKTFLLRCGAGRFGFGKERESGLCLALPRGGRFLKKSGAKIFLLRHGAGKSGRDNMGGEAKKGGRRFPPLRIRKTEAPQAGPRKGQKWKRKKICGSASWVPEKSV